jgi:hypothetical protein
VPTDSSAADTAVDAAVAADTTVDEAVAADTTASIKWRPVLAEDEVSEQEDLEWWGW